MHIHNTVYVVPARIMQVLERGEGYKAPIKHVKVCFERVNDESLVEFEALIM